MVKATHTALAVSVVGSSVKVSASLLVITMCMRMVSAAAMPSSMAAFSVSGRLHTAIMSPSSSIRAASRAVKPPTFPGSTNFTSTMLEDLLLISLLAMAPRHTSCTSAVISAVGR